MSIRRFGLGARLFLSTLVLGVALPAGAITTELYGFNINWTQDVSVGATWRVQNRDFNNIGKTNLDDTLCIQDVDGMRPNTTPGSISGDACTTSDPAANQRYVDAPGAYSVNGDDGNLNYDKWDVVAASGKWLSELSINRNGWTAFIRGLAFYDPVNTNFDESHPNDIFQASETRRPNISERSSARRLELLDVSIAGGFELPDFLGNRYLQLKAGDQVLNWGESTFLLLNSLSATNPIDAPRLRLPGFAIAELFSPIGILSASTSLTENISAEVFYNYEWESFIVDPPGTFFSTVDIVGETDRPFALLSFGKQPEDPDALYDPANNPDDGTGLISSSSRTLFLADPITPPDSGQFGLRLNYFADWIGDGTELSFYFFNYHSRLPYVSAYAANATCIGETTTLIAQAIADCGGAAGPNAQQIVTDLIDTITNGDGDTTALEAMGGGSEGTSGRLQLAQEPLPVDTVRLVRQYPEDIRTYGLSFNTTVFGLAFSGEYAFRPNFPLQIDTVDLVFASLQPAFPRNNIVAADGAGGDANIVIPGRRAAVPDFIENVQRGTDAQEPNGLIEGFERVNYGKLDLTLLNTIGGSNFINASRILMVFELGLTHVDTPNLGQFQLSPAGIGTHISDGADGTQGQVDNFSATGPDNAPGDVCDNTCRQNPTSGSTAIGGLYDDVSAGYRFIFLPTYESAFWGVNVEPLLGFFHDFYGTTPGPGGAHVENRMQILAGLRFNYLNSIGGEIRYNGITNVGGTGRFIGDGDRDTISAFLRYEF